MIFLQNLMPQDGLDLQAAELEQLEQNFQVSAMLCKKVKVINRWLKKNTTIYIDLIRILIYNKIFKNKIKINIVKALQGSFFWASYI